MKILLGLTGNGLKWLGIAVNGWNRPWFLPCWPLFQVNKKSTK